MVQKEGFPGPEWSWASQDLLLGPRWLTLLSPFGCAAVCHSLFLIARGRKWLSSPQKPASNFRRENIFGSFWVRCPSLGHSAVWCQAVGAEVVKEHRLLCSWTLNDSCRPFSVLWIRTLPSEQVTLTLHQIGSFTQRGIAYPPRQCCLAEMLSPEGHAFFRQYS